MARPSKLTPEQRLEIIRRRAEGEGLRALAREFGVSPSVVERCLSGQSGQVRDVAERLASAQIALAQLPVPLQHTAMTLADKLRNISTSLACAAELGAATAHRLQSLANSEVGKVDDATPMASLDNLRNVGVLTKLANDSAAIALNLLSANKETVTKINNPQDAETLAPVRERLPLAEWKKAHGLA